MDDYIQERTSNNAWLIYKADFYPLYTQWLWKWLLLEELLILSFVYYWTKNWNYIYATNEDLAELVWTSSRTVKKFVKRLTDLWYIEVISKTIVWMGTDRKMKYTWKTIGGEKISLPTEKASKAQYTGGEKISLPKKKLKQANITGGEKISLPWGKNKFLDGNSDYKEKSQNFGIPPEGKNFPAYKNIYKENIFTTEISDEIPASQNNNISSTELSTDILFNDWSIDYYTKLALQQSSLDKLVEVLRPLYPHPRWYKGSKKDTVKAFKGKQLNYDYIYRLIYDMKLLWFMCEYNIVRWPWFMSQRVDTYVPSTEKQRDEDLTRIVTYVKRNNQDKELFKKRATDIVNLCWYEKYRKIFRSIPANREDTVDLSQIS